MAPVYKGFSFCHYKVRKHFSFNIKLKFELDKLQTTARMRVACVKGCQIMQTLPKREIIKAKDAESSKDQGCHSFVAN